jgi:predicted  nucleic acid-binding Zn-ribbon protein
MDAYDALQDAYKALQKAIDKALSTLGDNTGNGVAELQAAIEKAQQTVANPAATPEELQAETTALNAAVNVFKEVQTAKSSLQKAIDEATALIADNTSAEATALQEAIDKATQIANNMASTAEELAAATAELKEASFIFQLANGTGASPVVVTNDYVARGSTMALGRSTVSGISTSNLLEQGFCWSTSPNPTVLDNRTTKYQNQNGRIYIMENLEPSTIYYVRAYALTKTYAVGYGEAIKVITLPAGKVTWSYDNGADDAANARINAAVENAVYYMNTWTSINGLHTSVHYGSGTPTADC